MSAPRQNRRCVVGLCIAFVMATVGAVAAQPEIGPVVTDPQTGLAIGGFDPVAYFTDASPQLGRAELEYRLAGTTWRFRNEGNRAAFIEHPEVYAPQFGGYDPVAIARGVLVAGHPMVWVVNSERLYLFYDAKARAEFLAAPGRMIDLAERRWPEVRRTLP